MRRDPKAFRERFKAWKNGLLVYLDGRPTEFSGYEGGKDDEDWLYDNPDYTIPLKEVTITGNKPDWLRAKERDAEYERQQRIKAADPFLRLPKEKGLEIISPEFDLISLGGMFKPILKNAGKFIYNGGRVILKDIVRNPNNFYRSVGKSAIVDAKKTGIIRGNPASLDDPYPYFARSREPWDFHNYVIEGTPESADWISAYDYISTKPVITKLPKTPSLDFTKAYKAPLTFRYLDEYEAFPMTNNNVNGSPISKLGGASLLNAAKNLPQFAKYVWNGGKVIQRNIPTKVGNYYRTVHGRAAIDDAISTGVIRGGKTYNQHPYFSKNGLMVLPSKNSFVIEGTSETPVQWTSPYKAGTVKTPTGLTIPRFMLVENLDNPTIEQLMPVKDVITPTEAIPWSGKTTLVPTTGFSYWLKHPIIGWRNHLFASNVARIRRNSYVARELQDVLNGNPSGLPLSVPGSKTIQFTPKQLVLPPYNNKMSIADNFYNNVYNSSIVQPYDLENTYAAAKQYADSPLRQQLFEQVKRDAANAGYISENSALKLNRIHTTKPTVRFKDLGPNDYGKYDSKAHQVTLNTEYIHPRTAYHEFLHSLDVGEPFQRTYDVDEEYLYLTNLFNKYRDPIANEKTNRIVQDAVKIDKYYADKIASILKPTASEYHRTPAEAINLGLDEGYSLNLSPFSPKPKGNGWKNFYNKSITGQNASFFKSLIQDENLSDTYWKLVTGLFLPFGIGAAYLGNKTTKQLNKTTEKK